MAEIINIEDIELAKLCARGDEKARHELYTRYAAYLFALCIRYVGDRELARDLMHDAMIKIFDTVGKYRLNVKFRLFCIFCITGTKQAERALWRSSRSLL